MDPSVRAGVMVVVTLGSLAGAPAALGQGSSSAPVLSVSDTQKTQVLRFDRSRDPKAKTVPVRIKPFDKANLKIPNASVQGDMISAEDNVIPEEKVTVGPGRPDGTSGVKFRVEVDPKGAPAGRYSTLIEFGGNGYDPVAVTLQATLKDSIVGALLWALGGLIAGLVLKAIADIYKARPRGGRRPSLGSWFNRTGFAVTIAVSLVAVLAAFWTTYQSNRVWGAESLDGFKLAVTSFGYVIAGVTLTDIVTPYKAPTG